MESLLGEHHTASKRICVRCIKILPDVDFAARSPTNPWDFCLRHGYIWTSPRDVLNEYQISTISSGSLNTPLHWYTPKFRSLNIDNQITLEDHAEGQVAYLETSIELCPVTVLKMRSARRRRSILKAASESQSRSAFLASLLKYAHIPICQHLCISDPQVLAAYNVEALVEEALRKSMKSFRCCVDCRRVGATTQFHFQLVHCADETADRQDFALKLVLVRGLRVVSGLGSAEAVHRSPDWECHVSSVRLHLKQR